VAIVSELVPTTPGLGAPLFERGGKARSATGREGRSGQGLAGAFRLSFGHTAAVAVDFEKPRPLGGELHSNP
jgi:hypothetical protein